MLIINLSRSLDIVNDKREIFEVRSPTQILSTPRSGKGKISHTEWIQ